MTTATSAIFDINFHLEFRLLCGNLRDTSMTLKYTWRRSADNACRQASAGFGTLVVEPSEYVYQNVAGGQTADK